MVLFDRGDEVTVLAGEDGIRFLLVSGKPLEEPVAWYGPIVMNTQEQLRQAMSDLHAFFERLVPENQNYFVHTAEGPDDMPAHVKTMLTTTSLQVPVLNAGSCWEHGRRFT